VQCTCLNDFFLFDIKSVSLGKENDQRSAYAKDAYQYEKQKRACAMMHTSYLYCNTVGVVYIFGCGIAAVVIYFQSCIRRKFFGAVQKIGLPVVHLWCKTSKKVSVPAYMATKLFVGNLPWSVTDEQLNELFGQAGTVVSVMVIKHKFTGRSKGFGFVEMENEQVAQDAITKFNGYEMDGRKLIVNEARPLVPRDPNAVQA